MTDTQSTEDVAIKFTAVVMRYDIEIPAGLVPDMQAQYMHDGAMFRPDAGIIRYVMEPDVSPWKVSSVVVSGSMVNKNGEVSKSRTNVNHYYSELGLPGWLTDIVRENRPAD